MQARNKYLKTAKIMFKNSLENGTVNASKVDRVLKLAVYKKSLGLIQILKIYKRLVLSALSLEEAVVECAQKLKNEKQIAKALIEKTHARRVKFRVNPKIVFGARLYHGDWIWDGSLDAKLCRLSKK